jgi:hypothetical protein
MSRECYGCERCKAPSTKLPPSRLEIAMHLFAAMQANADLTHLTDMDFAEAAVEQADTLIAVEKSKKHNSMPGLSKEVAE